ncbi:3'-5' exonuclease [uncultured Halovibrio sp.]|uniref:3'-5' exonuclease n=1 Tax=uncultured Halovibrio sp. TaxID=985049 RepID=UPI0025F61B98|nr:3'-5' exonuclease [uncultured Halovibrio sp.]
MLSPHFLKGAAPGWPEYMADRARKCGNADLKAFFEQGSLDPETPIKRVPMMAMDLETTGMDVTRHGIVSVGMLPFTLERIHTGQSWYRIVRPRRMLREESVVVHHITHSEVADAPDLADILPELLNRMAGYLPVVHYHPIERRFLDESVRVRLGEGLMCPMLDTMVLESRWCRQSLRARMRKWLGAQPLSIRLHESRARYNLPFYRGHHALTDALATAELFQAQVAHRFSPETPVGDLWV